MGQNEQTETRAKVSTCPEWLNTLLRVVIAIASALTAGNALAVCSV